MKAVFIFALLFTLSFAIFTPDWKSCSASDDSWQPTTVTFEKEPKVNENDSMHACGNVQDAFTVGGFKLQVKAGSVIIHTTEVKLTKQDVFPGSQYCFDYTVFIPIIARGSFFLTFQLQDDTKDIVGCFNINMNIKGTEIVV